MDRLKDADETNGSHPTIISHQRDNMGHGQCDPIKIAKCCPKIISLEKLNISTLYKICLRMQEIWASQLLPKALKICPKSKKSPNMVTLDTDESLTRWSEPKMRERLCLLITKSRKCSFKFQKDWDLIGKKKSYFRANNQDDESKKIDSAFRQ